MFLAGNPTDKPKICTLETTPSELSEMPGQSMYRVKLSID